MVAKRLPRNTRVDPIRAGWEIERARKERIDKLAEHAGVSASAYIERVIDHLEEELTDRGVPQWWPQPEPDDGELPIDTA